MLTVSGKGTSYPENSTWVPIKPLKMIAWALRIGNAYRGLDRGEKAFWFRCLYVHMYVVDVYTDRTLFLHSHSLPRCSRTSATEDNLMSPTSSHPSIPTLKQQACWEISRSGPQLGFRILAAPACRESRNGRVLMATLGYVENYNASRKFSHQNTFFRLCLTKVSLFFLSLLNRSVP